MKILSNLDGADKLKQDSDNRFVTDAEKSTWNGKADKTYVDSKVQIDVPADAKFTDTITSVNGQIGDIELTADDLDYFDYNVGHNRNVGSTLSEINDVIYMFVQFIVGTDYDALNDPTLKEILEMFAIVLGDYELGISPSLGEIVELVVGGGPIVDLGTFNDVEELITHVVMNQLPTGNYTFIMNNFPHFVLLEQESTFYRGTFHASDMIFNYFVVSIYGEIQDLKTIDLRDLSALRVYVDGEIGRKADKNYVDSQDALKADKTYVDGKVQTDVPSGAKFTDTVTTINGKTGAISKADIVALGIPSSDTNTTYSEISTHEIDTGTSTTLRTITGRRVKYILDKIQGWISGLTKSDIGLGNVDNTSDASKPISTATQTALDGKVNNSQVQTNVPSGAKFTDTITTINGNTGAIAKADITALGIPAQDTVVDISGKADKTYVDNKVKTDVPTNAKFTDTNTTYSEMTTAEIDTGTSTTLRTITGRRVKYILDKVQGWIGGLTKSDVGLSNVDNIKQMPISGGVLENYREKLVTVHAGNGTIDLSLGNVFQHTPSGNRSYTIINARDGQAHSFTLIINMGSTVRTLYFPASVKWQGGEIPDMSSANKTYVLTFMTVDGGTNWLGMFGGEF